MIIPMMSAGGGTPKTELSIVIMFNIFLLLVLAFFVYQYHIDKDYIGSFWEWSWDENYKFRDFNKTLEVIDTYASVAGICFWIPFFVINGMAFFAWVSNKIEKLL